MSGKTGSSPINRHQNTRPTKFSRTLNMKLHAAKSKQKQFYRINTESS